MVGGVPAGSIHAPRLGSVLAEGLPRGVAVARGVREVAPARWRGSVCAVGVLLHPHELAFSRQRFLGGPRGELGLCRGCPLHPEEEEEEAGGQRGRQRAPPPATAGAVKPSTKRLSLPTYGKAKQGPTWFWCCALGAVDDPHGGRWCHAPPGTGAPRGHPRLAAGVSAPSPHGIAGPLEVGDGPVPSGAAGGAVHVGYSFLTYFAGGCQKVCQELRASRSGLSGQGHRLLDGFAPFLLVLPLFLLDLPLFLWDLPPFLAGFAPFSCGICKAGGDALGGDAGSSGALVNAAAQATLHLPGFYFQGEKGNTGRTLGK